MDRIASDQIAQLARVGFVTARQPERHRVRVEFRDTVTAPLVSGWLPVLAPRASADMAFDLPDVGDQVLCLFLGNGLEDGFVLGSMYGAQKPPVSSGDTFHRTFSDGTTLEYDRKAHKLTASVVGEVSVQAARAISLDAGESINLRAPALLLNGNLSQSGYDGGPGFSDVRGTVTVRDGSITVPHGDVLAAAVSLLQHIHMGVQSGGDTSGAPLAQTPPGNNPGALEDAFNDTVDSLTGLEGSDELLLCLPEIAENMALMMYPPEDSTGWSYLKSMFHKWFSGNANEKPEKNKEPFWVDWDWIMSYGRAKDAYDEMCERSYLFSNKAQKALATVLEKQGLLTKDKMTFDHINTPWWQWKEGYFQRKPVDGFHTITIDGLLAAMGTFNLCALAQGTVEPLPQGGHRIKVDKVAVFVWDIFNFEGEYPLGYWSCKKKMFSALGGQNEFVLLHNSDFKDFRNRTGKGDDFFVLSHPHIVETFGFMIYDTSL